MWLPYGRLVGELMRWMDLGELGGQEISVILPGGFAVLGAGAMAAGVTRTFSPTLTLTLIPIPIPTSTLSLNPTPTPTVTLGNAHDLIGHPRLRADRWADPRAPAAAGGDGGVHDSGGLLGLHLRLDPIRQGPHHDVEPYPYP